MGTAWILNARMGGGGEGVGKSNAKVYVENRPELPLKDVAGEMKQRVVHRKSWISCTIENVIQRSVQKLPRERC